MYCSFLLFLDLLARLALLALPDLLAPLALLDLLALLALLWRLHASRRAAASSLLFLLLLRWPRSLRMCSRSVPWNGGTQCGTSSREQRGRGSSVEDPEGARHKPFYRHRL